MLPAEPYTGIRQREQPPQTITKMIDEHGSCQGACGGHYRTIEEERSRSGREGLGFALEILGKHTE